MRCNLGGSFNAMRSLTYYVRVTKRRPDTEHKQSPNLVLRFKGAPYDTL